MYNLKKQTMKKSILILLTISFVNVYSQNLYYEECPFNFLNDLNSTVRAIETGADPNQTDKNGATLLMWAAYKGNFESLKYLIKKGANPNAKGIIYKSKDLESYYGNLLTISVSKNNTEMVKYLVETLKISVSEPEMFASDSSKLAKLFYKHNSKPMGWTPLIYATYNANISMVKYLVSKGANLNYDSYLGNTAIYYAAYQPDETLAEQYNEIFFYLASKGANLVVNDKVNGYSLLHLAAFHNNTKQIQFLLNNKAKVDATTKLGSSPLYLASEHNNFSAASMLIEKGANINFKRNTDGLTPLITAIKSGKDTMALFLINKGADLNLQNSSLETPLHHAINEKLDTVSTILLKKGANPNAKTEKGTTPLMLAARKGNMKIVKALLNKGANANIKNDEGTLAIDFALFNDHYEVASYLKNPICYESNLLKQLEIITNKYSVAAEAAKKEGIAAMYKFIHNTTDVIMKTLTTNEEINYWHTIGDNYELEEDPVKVATYIDTFKDSVINHYKLIKIQKFVNIENCE